MPFLLQIMKSPRGKAILRSMLRRASSKTEGSLERVYDVQAAKGHSSVGEPKQHETSVA